jgi:hypothetical protein
MYLNECNPHSEINKQSEKERESVCARMHDHACKVLLLRERLAHMALHIHMIMGFANLSVFEQVSIVPIFL